MIQLSVSSHSPHASRTVRARLIEFLKLLIGSSAAGFSIAVLQHYVTFGVRGYGFGHDAILLACFEGGILGVIFGVPTGLFIYYVTLQGSVTLKQIVLIILGSLIVGCGGGIIFDWFFAFATPLLTIFIAWGIKAYQLYQEAA
jgi:hypothetical protein